MFINIINVPIQNVIMNGMSNSLFKGEKLYPLGLKIGTKQINDLRNRALGLERSDRTLDAYLASFKICPTRHGCTGATNCDYELSGPVGR